MSCVLCRTALKQVEPLLSELRQCSQQSLQDALKASQEDRDKEYQWTATVGAFLHVLCVCVVVVVVCACA